MLTYSFPNDKQFLKTMIMMLEDETADSKHELASILKVSSLTFDPSPQFTRNKWDHYWTDVVISTPYKYSKILQKSDNKKILSDLIESLLPPDCGYELYDIKLNISITEDTDISKENGITLDEIKEVAKAEINKYNLKYGCLIGHKSCAETSHIVEKYDVRNVFLDISYDERYADFEEAIIEVLDTAKLKPVMAKDTIKSSVLLCKICSYIRTCKYGISDISYPSLNVAYELGVMQTLNKPTAIFLNKQSTKPSDLEGLEHIPYTSAKTLKPLLARWIIDNTNESDKKALQLKYL